MKFGKQGFTLLEVLITIITFVVVIVALIEAFNIGILGSGDVEKMRTASSIAQAKMEDIRNNYVVNSESSTAFDSIIVSSAEAPDANFPDFKVKADVITAADSNTKTVTVKVSWTYRGSPVDISLATLMARYVEK